MQQQDKPQQPLVQRLNLQTNSLQKNKTKAGVKLQRLVCNTSLLKKAQVNNQLRSLWLKYIEADINGQVFDSSYSAVSLLSFLNQVIPG